MQTILGTRRLSFASESDLYALLGLPTGSVTPLGALNDGTNAVMTVIDTSFIQSNRIAAHPCDNTATLLIATNDLIDLLESLGHPIRIADLSNSKTTSSSFSPSP